MCFFHLLMLNFYLLIHNNFCFINWENTSPHWIGSTTYSRVSQAWLTGSSFEWVLTLGDLLFPHKIDFNFRHWEKKISETLSEPSPPPPVPLNDQDAAKPDKNHLSSVKGSKLSSLIDVWVAITDNNGIEKPFF